MSNPHKAKGTKWEVDVVNYLRAQGHPDALRVVPEGLQDQGDIRVREEWVLQAKAWSKVLDGISAGVLGYLRQRKAASLPYGAAVVKRPGKNVREGYVVMRLEDFAALLRDFYARRSG